MQRVLIVEDQPDIRKLIRMTLEFEAYEIIEAPDGEQGLRLAIELLPDLMLLDVMMPGGIDGLEVCRRIRANPRHRRTKILMLSARDQATDRRAGKDAGADDYLTKPFSPRELLQAVTRAL